MYLTTSRKPSILSKRLCRALSALFPRGIYENRGKKSIESVADRARQLGKSRVLLLYERQGNPDKFLFMDVGKGWEWLTPEIMLKKLGTVPKIELKAKEARFEGEEAQKLANLFNLESPSGDEDIRIVLEPSQWSFYSGRKKMLSFGVEHA